MKKFVFAMACLGTLLCAQSTVGLNINSEDIEAEGSMDISSFANSGGGGTAYMVDANFINTERDDTLFGIGVSAHNSFSGLEGLNFAFGAKLIMLDDFVALPLMAEASYTLPLIETIPTTSLSARFLYAPQPLSFSDAENYLEFRTEAAMEVISSVSVYLGYRNIETEYIVWHKDTYETYNDSVYGGLKMGF
jgi:hypothetical protein